MKETEDTLIKNTNTTEESCCSGSSCCGSESNSAPQVPKLKRNDPCFCGSGLKYKKCCGK